MMSLKDTAGSREDHHRPRADLSAAQERLEFSPGIACWPCRPARTLPQVAAAQAVLHQAQAAADQAALAVTQAEASLALIDTQIAKLTITAPADGTILTSSIQPGEIVAPSAAAMTLGRLDTLTITVYVPEDRYGELSLGQSASSDGGLLPRRDLHRNGQPYRRPG